MKFHLQLERTIDVVIEAADRRTAIEAVDGMSSQEINDLAEARGDFWMSFIDTLAPRFAGKAEMELVDGRLIALELETARE